MRILFTYIGGLGHFYPLVPLARAAAEAGHVVAVAGSGRLTAHVEAAGFEALATSPARPVDEPPPVRDLTPVAPVDARAAEVEFAQNFADKGARRHATALREHFLAWRPDVVVRDEADLVVSHGGSGGLMGALAHGLPSVLLPLGADQPHNAGRAVERGLARELDAATVTPEQIHESVRAALADAVMAQRARRVADEIAALPGVEATVPLLEALADGHRDG